MPLSLEARYTAAHQELSTRVASRQAIATTYMTIALPFIGLLLAPGGSPFSDEVRAWIALVLPVLSFCFSLWYTHQDRLIGLLSTFLCACEEIDDGASKLPSWHTPDQGWISQGLAFRRSSDVAFVTALLGSSVSSVLFAYSRLPTDRLSSFVLFAAAALGGSGAFFIAIAQKKRTEMLKWTLATTNGKLKLQRNAEA